MPAQYFIGIEPAMLVPLALAQMIENMTRREHGYWLRGKRGYGAGVDDARAALTIELGVVITSNIYLPTARTMLPKDQVDRDLAKLGISRSDEEWRDTVVPTLIANPILREEVETLFAKSRAIGILPEPPIDDSDPKRSSQYERVTERVAGLVRSASRVGRRGFYLRRGCGPTPSGRSCAIAAVISNTIPSWPPAGCGERWPGAKPARGRRYTHANRHRDRPAASSSARKRAGSVS